MAMKNLIHGPVADAYSVSWRVGDRLCIVTAALERNTGDLIFMFEPSTLREPNVLARIFARSAVQDEIPELQDIALPRKHAPEILEALDLVVEHMPSLTDGMRGLAASRIAAFRNDLEGAR